ncbi:MAG: amidohydrolase family protein [Acidobacteriaceae bacterium]|nr:amidohydrolase family protein [Acidobacteriaceae bacterium]
MAKTPWGELPISDAHVHFFSRPFFTALARERKFDEPEPAAALLNWELPARDPALLALRWISEMDRYGIARVCLIASTHGDEDSVGSAVSSYPDRFFGFFMLNPLLPDAIDRVRIAARNPGLHCVCLFPAMHTYSITDERVVPLLEIASDHRLAVFVHCGAITVGARKKLGLPSQFDVRYGNPLDLHPVALHFPKIRFIVPHFGAGLFREALMLADLCPNVYFDTSSSNRWMLYESLDLRSVFRRTIDVVGLDRILFGTDSSFFPRGWNAPVFDAQAKALYELGLEADEAHRILHTNLVNLFEREKTKA